VPTAPVECREVLYEGRVQGVGFRYTTRRIAARYEVSGFVRNLGDGRVQLVAEGAAAELDRFLAEVQQQMDRYIQHVHCGSLAASGQYRGFEIH
jgi:acylphosphatase